jgi:DNA-binding transcriptional LysR family regulator
MNAIAALPSLHQQQLPSSFSTSYAGVVAFITVATEGSFARAADRLGVGRSAVSRSVQKLEAQLGARLFSRTTRSTTLTSDGERFFDHCRPGVERILQAMEEMRDLREGPPRGLLRIRASHGFGRKVLAPLMIDFRRLYPEVALELMLDDRSDDLAMERVDLAFREGRLEDSQIIAKQIIPLQLLVCASPAYAQTRGLPQTLDDLRQHACINRRQPSGRLQPWEFRSQGHALALPLLGDIVINDDDLALRAVLDGQGLAQLPAYQVCDALRSGALVACLQPFAPDDRGHYLCYLSRRQQPKRIRVFIDYITQRMRALDLGCAAPLDSRVAQAA